MSFDPFVTAVIESTLNLLLNDDPQLGHRLSRFKGKVIQVHLREVNKTLTFVFSQQIDVLANFEGRSDCYLSLNVSVLPQLREQSNITQLIKQDKVVLEGDIQLAQRFSQLLMDCKPDLEEWLSRLTGDVFAHSFAQGVIGLKQRAKAQMDKGHRRFGQVLTEEWQLAPAPLEVAYFCDQVDELKSQSARIDGRLNKLLEVI
ncbi:ubiquinone biosynthesis accessory factor UbiJ [Vibrio ostreicida]|uniref:Ubiquinone biosynthesis accessory factor UbiJ n=1 Tax=Vibrio ostreicida TaxID=526588 RepID=A0ABT8BNF0_9VIBR|nr:SCP2 domain-containing protein [Vibrio ostreicida]MDN3608687.1 SCP2 domain-containing protein [Vibrio ostreicida]NPD10629.1 SCP2 domain-containing protein [Vibrio ostreicida]